jgi:hypothetical protein
VDAYRYTPNEMIHNDLGLECVDEVIRNFATRYEQRLHQHTNVLVLELLDTEFDIRLLKRTKPLELALQIVLVICIK